MRPERLPGERLDRTGRTTTGNEWNPRSLGTRVKLLDVLEPKLTSSQDRALLVEVRAFAGTSDLSCSDLTIL